MLQKHTHAVFHMITLVKRVALKPFKTLMWLNTKRFRDKDIGTLLRHFIKQLKQGDRKAMESYEIRWRDGLQSLYNLCE